MLGWVLSGFSVGSQKMNIFQKVDKNNFHKKKSRKITKKKKEKKGAGSHGCSVGFSVGSQWVLSGYSVSTQGSQWVLRLSISECSGGSQVGTSPRASNAFVHIVALINNKCRKFVVVTRSRRIDLHWLFPR